MVFATHFSVPIPGLRSSESGPVTFTEPADGQPRDRREDEAQRLRSAFMPRVQRSQLLHRFSLTIAELWRPVLLPTLVLWILATYLAGALLRSYDITEYLTYAHAALRLPILHALPKEYPAPALLVFLVPLLIPLGYPWAFAILVGVALAALSISLYRSVPWVDPEATRRLLLYLVVGAVMFLTARYDVFAAAAAFWSVRSASRHRWSTAWAWSAVGAAIKLFPAVLWPALFIAEYRRTKKIPWKRMAWAIGATVAVLGVPAVFDPSATLSVLHYYSLRPPEVGSLAAGISLVLDPGAWHHVMSFHSFNTVSPLAGPIADVVAAVAGCGCLLVWLLQRRGGLSLEATALATMTLVVLGSKVVSVQYLLWLMPLWALYRPRVSWILAAFVNSIVFPYTATTGLNHFLSGHAVAFLALLYLVRDVLILAGTAAWLTETRDRRSEPGHVSIPPLVRGGT